MPLVHYAYYTYVYAVKAPLLPRNTAKTRIVDRAKDGIVGADT